MTDTQEKVDRRTGKLIPYLTAWRKAKLVTTAELARMSGHSRSGVERIEHGGSASFTLIKDLAAALGISTDDLLNVNPDKARKR